MGTGGTPETRFGLAEIPVPMVHATHRIIRNCNGEFASLFGVERSELINYSFSRLYPELDDFVRVGDIWRLHLSGGAVFYDERIMRGSGGRRFWCRVSGRSRSVSDPFADALYCFEPISRPLTDAKGQLTGRQVQILTLVAQGKTNAQIAAELSLSRRTVEAHRHRLMRAIGVRNAAELMAWFSSSS